MWKIGTSVLVLELVLTGLVLSVEVSFSFIMSATEAATLILFGSDVGLGGSETRILGERFLKKVGERGRNNVSVLVVSVSGVEVVVVVVVGLEVRMAWKRTGLLLGTTSRSRVPLCPPVLVGSRVLIGRVVSTGGLEPSVTLVWGAGVRLKIIINVIRDKHKTMLTETFIELDNCIMMDVSLSKLASGLGHWGIHERKQQISQKNENFKRSTLSLSALPQPPNPVQRF